MYSLHLVTCSETYSIFYTAIWMRLKLWKRRRNFFYVHVTVHPKKFLFNKTNRCSKFPNLFYQETLYVSGSSSAHHQKFSTVHSALVYVMQVSWQLSSTTRMKSWSCLKAVIKPAWLIPEPNVQWKTPDDGQRNCPKHIEFLDKINLGI